MDEISRQIWFAGVAPGVIAGVLFLLAWRPWQRTVKVTAGQWGSAAGIGLAVVASRLILDQWPRDAWETILFGAAAALAFGVLATLWGRRWWAFVLFAMIGTAVACWLVQRFFIAEAFWIRAIPAWGALVLALGIEPLLRKRRGFIMPLCLALPGFAMGVVIVLSGNVSIGFAGIALSAALTAGVVVGAWNRSFSLGGGASIVFAVVTVAAPLAAWASSYEFGLSSAFAPVFFIVAGAPLALWLAEASKGLDKKPWLAALVRIGLVAIPAGVGLFIAFSNTDTSAYG